MSDVFISYTHADRQVAAALADVFTRRGLSVWWDHEIVIGREYDQEIETALTSASAVVVLWSRASIASKWVRAEAGLGADRNMLVPVLLDGSPLPLRFRDIQAADLSTWHGEPTHDGMTRLLQSLDHQLAGAGRAPSRLAATGASPPSAGAMPPTAGPVPTREVTPPTERLRPSDPSRPQPVLAGRSPARRRGIRPWQVVVLAVAALGVAAVTILLVVVSGGGASDDGGDNGAELTEALTSPAQRGEGDLLRSPSAEYTLRLQHGDGNLVVYRRDGKAMWNSGPPGGSNPYELHLTNAGVLRVTGAGTELWEKRFGGTPPHSLVMQDDGNLVLYDKGHVAVWDSYSDAGSLVAPSQPGAPPTSATTPASRPSTTTSTTKATTSSSGTSSSTTPTTPTTKVLTTPTTG